MACWETGYITNYRCYSSVIIIVCLQVCFTGDLGCRGIMNAETRTRGVGGFCLALELAER